MSEGMYHNEGGWRPDVNPTDSNQLMRWRRKIEKDDHYVTKMVKISNVSISAAQCSAADCVLIFIGAAACTAPKFCNFTEANMCVLSLVQCAAQHRHQTILMCWDYVCSLGV